VLSLLADAFDTEQLLECMGQLKREQPVNVPIYDFKKHRKCSEGFRKVVIFFFFSLDRCLPWSTTMMLGGRAWT
jgi:hypothetical protein